MEGPLTVEDLSGMDVSRLAKVGPKKLKGLHQLGIGSLFDLLTHYPRRYLDRTRQQRVADLDVGEEALVLASVRSVSARRTRNNKMMVTADFHDGSGTLRCTFFNQPWRQRQLESDDLGEVALFGKVEVFNGRRQMTNPVVDPIGTRTGRIVSIYPLSEKSGLSTWEISSWVQQVLRRCEKRGIDDPVPPQLLREFDLMGRQEAIGAIHAPSSMAHMELARRRLVFDELLRLQLFLVQQKRDLERNSKGLRHVIGDDDGVAPGMVKLFIDSLPYELTKAQGGAIAEIGADLASPVPMHRLLQGDVGSGKTVVALASLLTAIQGGHQGALMAPTEVLAEQHAASIRSMVGALIIKDSSSLLGERPVSIGLLTNRTKAAERRRILEGLSNGSIDLAVGTHALIEDAVRFRSLGVVVIDEQHRFGVEQRAALRTANSDGTVPDLLVMTATPIPRTAAMTVYGDLDVTVLDELPPGRTPIVTTWANDGDDEMAGWDLVRSQVGEGHQAYVVCPLIEGSDKIEASSATETFEELEVGALAGLRLGLLHGRMSSDDKDAVMGRFRGGQLDVLVATTVIEVGVDVPNATVMVILDADRFGMAQLHQLRGRVGRGAAHSHCILVSRGEPTPDGEARLEAMVASTDGFELAEIDLDLRGEGTVMGERQKGRNDLKLASLRRDRDWVEKARNAALDLVGDGLGLADYPNLVAEVRLLLDEGEREFLLKG